MKRSFPRRRRWQVCLAFAAAAAGSSRAIAGDVSAPVIFQDFENSYKTIENRLAEICANLPNRFVGLLLKFLIQPKVLNEYLKAGLGRNIPCMPSIAKDDPWWRADPHRAAYVQQGLLGPTVPNFWVFNPAYASVENTHVWPMAWADVITNWMTPPAAAEKAFKRVEEIFAKYPITQG